MLFAKDSTVRIYFAEDGSISEVPTEDWVEVLEELPYYLHEKLLKKGKARISQDGDFEVSLDFLMFEADFYAEVIKNWSVNLPVTKENVQKLKSPVLNSLGDKLRQMYNLGGGNDIQAGIR